MILFLIGLLLGGILSTVLMACLVAGKYDDMSSGRY
ncbi:hypothetical protein IGI52_000389 [Enterococcus sp. DIV0187]